MLAMFILKECIIKHVALTGSSNKNLLFTDKLTFFKKKFGQRVIFHFTLVLRKFLISILSRISIEKLVSLVLGDLFLFIFS